MIPVPSQVSGTQVLETKREAVHWWEEARNQERVMRKYAAELLGTFILVFMGTGAAVANQVSGGAISHVGISLTFGLVVLSLVYTLGDISGAHINPAVSLGFALAGRFPWKQTVPYIVSQCGGALLASGLLLVLFRDSFPEFPLAARLGATLPAGSEMQSFVLEVILTWFLMLAVLAVSSGAKEKGLMAGVAVGAVVGLEALFAGPICGASMNPARSLGPALVSGHTGSLWIYLVAPVLGAFLAVATFAVLEPARDAVDAGR